MKSINLQKYPLGLQDFPSTRQERKVNVDKTKYALEFVQARKSIFLSKSRRLGKPIFSSALDGLFLGRKDAFLGLYIHDKCWFEAYPIFRSYTLVFPKLTPLGSYKKLRCPNLKP